MASLDQLYLLPPALQKAILDGPAMVPPENEVSNFENPPNNNRAAHIALAICLTITTLFFMIRFYSRVFVLKKAHLEDYIGALSYPFYVSYIAMNYWMLAEFGFFVHQWNIQVKRLETLLYMIYIGRNMYNVFVGLIKISILKEWSRLFAARKRNAFWWTCHAIMVVNALYYVSLLFMYNLACIPRKKIWDKTVPGGRCIDEKSQDLGAACVNLAFDLAILLLPQRTIWKLNAPLKRRIGLSIIFAIGLLCCASASARIAVSVSWYDAEDVTYSVASVTLWAIAEMTCMFLVFCVTAAPNAFGEQGILSRVGSSFRSWASLTPKGSSKGDSSKSWGRSDGTGSDPASKYVPINDQGIPLNVVKIDGKGASSSTENLHAPPEAAIMATTRYTVQESYNTENNQRDWRR